MISQRPGWMQLPRRVVAGPGAISEIAEVCHDLNLKGLCLILTGPTTKDILGKEISDRLQEGGFSSQLAVTKQSRIEEVNCATMLAAKVGASFIIGAGGGRSIDIAKLASKELDLPFLSIPSAASHDGIASAQASLTIKGESTSVSANAPLAIVADIRIIARAPHRLLAAGCGDIISNYTAILDWRLAQRVRSEEFSEYAAALSKMTARMIVELAQNYEPGREESAKVVVQALISSGVAMSIAGSSRPASGSEHKFAHAVNRLAPGKALHGELCGIGTIIMMYLHGGRWKMILDALQKLGCPTTAAEVGLDPDVVVEALVNAHNIRPERYTILGTGLTKEAAEKAAKYTRVI